MQDGKIYITITDKPVGVGEKTSKETDGDGKKENKANALADYAKHEFFHLIKQQALAQINYEVSKIGNLKGEYVRQHNVEVGINVGRQILGIGESAVAGFMLGGVPGAIIGGSVVAIGTVASYFRQEDMIAKQNAITNFQIKYLQERSGLYSLNNGSRGTNN